MPKLKTHSSSKKRFKITATGKVKRARPLWTIYWQRNLGNKRNLRKTTVASDSNAVVIKKLLPYGR